MRTDLLRSAKTAIAFHESKARYGTDHRVKRSNSMAAEATPTYADVLGIKVEALDMEMALTRIEQTLSERTKGYVCMAGVHGIMEAQRLHGLADIYAKSLMVLPDGMPTVWVGRCQGCREMRRVTGPDLMIEVFRRKEFAGCTHFLYGGKAGVAEELAATLAQRFPWTRIVGTYTPPFRDLLPAEEEQLIATVRNQKPNIIWVGISTPKQEQFMQQYLPMLETTLMFGVGAAFDFHAGRINDCADWIKRAGLQWLHRLIQDPRHLWRRYLRNNPAFMWRIALQFMGLRAHTTAQRVRAIEQAHNSPRPETRTLREAVSESIRAES